MRVVAALASLAVAFAAATLPASFVTIRADEQAQMSAQSDGERDEDGTPTQGDGESTPDDDLDERLDDLDELDELLAVLDTDHRTFVPESTSSIWHAHQARSPRAPHPEDTLRPPIAA